MKGPRAGFEPRSVAVFSPYMPRVPRVEHPAAYIQNSRFIRTKTRELGGSSNATGQPAHRVAQSRRQVIGERNHAKVQRVFRPTGSLQLLPRTK
jgi:hypothetical protein